MDVFEPQGALQLYVDSLQPSGFGNLAIRFEQLKARLSEEGLFDAARKRPLPDRPRVIAVVTSPTGAVWRDVCNVLARRWPLARVLLVACQVQGDGAPQSIVGALRRLERWIDEAAGAGRADEAPAVTILARGGGSLEDLWSFNDERVVRAIVAHPVPLVCGVGHEVDVTLADFAADVRAPTPSAAAELVVPDRLDLVAALRGRRARLDALALGGLGAASREVAAERRLLDRLDPAVRLVESRERASLLLDRATRATLARVNTARSDRGASLGAPARARRPRGLPALARRSMPGVGAGDPRPAGHAGAGLRDRPPAERRRHRPGPGRSAGRHGAARDAGGRGSRRDGRRRPRLTLALAANPRILHADDDRADDGTRRRHRDPHLRPGAGGAPARPSRSSRPAASRWNGRSRCTSVASSFTSDAQRSSRMQSCGCSSSSPAPAARSRPSTSVPRTPPRSSARDGALQNPATISYHIIVTESHPRASHAGARRATAHERSSQEPPCPSSTVSRARRTSAASPIRSSSSSPPRSARRSSGPSPSPAATSAHRWASSRSRSRCIGCSSRRATGSSGTRATRPTRTSC